MSTPLRLHVNGRERELEHLSAPATLKAVVEALAMRADRIAVELNGELAQRARWEEILVSEGSRLEIVHFVGGGCAGRRSSRSSSSVSHRSP